MKLINSDSEFSKESLSQEEAYLILVDKPLDWTSFDVVAKIRNLLRIKKIGHAGTLDPKATGLLILAVGKATKSIESIQAEYKEYIAEIKLGVTTASFDSESEEENPKDFSFVDKEMFENALKTFLGKQLQTPPIYSAKKVNGKRLYKYARKNEEVEIKKSEIEIFELELLDFSLPYIKFRMLCSKGVYVRSLANDLGEKLQTGAYLTGLRRSKSGDYNVANALSMDKIISNLSVQKEVLEEN